MTAPNDSQQHEGTTTGATDPTTGAPHQPQHTGPTETNSDPQLSAYIRHVVNSAPAPTPAQLQRLARLLPTSFK